MEVVNALDSPPREIPRSLFIEVVRGPVIISE
jgi:hypothetical protein